MKWRSESLVVLFRMTGMPVSLIHVTGFFLVCICSTPALSQQVLLRAAQIPVRHIDYRFAVQQQDSGVPRFDRKAFEAQPKKIIESEFDGLLLENDSLRVTLMPALGRVHSIVNKVTGNELLWINPCALPLGANNDTGFWMTWGGMERVLPRREHGTTHAIPWTSKTLSNTNRQATVRCKTKEPITGLSLELYYSLYADKNYLETTIVVRNPTKKTQQFSHWSTAVLAPGGSNEVTADTQLLFPADRFIPDDRDFNKWMEPLVGPVATSPLRKVGNWKSIGDLMTSPIREPYYAVYNHEKREGVVHTFDLAETPTVDIWGWGFPATPARQKEFTAEPPNKGYIEIWNGNVHGFKDENLASLEPGGLRTWCERTFAVQKLETDSLAKEIGDQVKQVAPEIKLAAQASEEAVRETATQSAAKLQIERSVVARGNDKLDWFQTRATAIPPSSDAKRARGLLLLQQKNHKAGHGYFDIYASYSDDQLHWTTPSAIPSLKRVTLDDGYDVVAGDLWPTFHAATGKVLATGKTFNFRESKREDILREKVAYAIFDPATEKWSELATLDMPDTDHAGRSIISPNAGCNQPIVDENGTIRLPVRYQTRNDWRNYVSVVVECDFDGERLTYRRHGSEHTHPVGRGLYEPSLVKFKDNYFLTLRADHDGFVAKGNDGLHFDEAVRWRFDDGQPLQSYNTQQHWVVGGGRLYLVYTRRGPDTGHIIRHRAPLYIAQVDPQTLRIIRKTEQILVPEEGRALGNSGVCRINDDESWVVVGEGAPGRGTAWTGNRVILAKLRW